jgi:hypothetical protein
LLSFATTGAMATGRSREALVKLGNGLVLAIRGLGPGRDPDDLRRGPLAETELYTPPNPG